MTETELEYNGTNWSLGAGSSGTPTRATSWKGMTARDDGYSGTDAFLYCGGADKDIRVAVNNNVPAGEAYDLILTGSFEYWIGDTVGALGGPYLCLYRPNNNQSFSDGGVRVQTNIYTSSNIIIRNTSSATVYTGTLAMVADTWYRVVVDLSISGSAYYCRVRIYSTAGALLLDSTPVQVAASDPGQYYWNFILTSDSGQESMCLDTVRIDKTS